MAKYWGQTIMQNQDFKHGKEPLRSSRWSGSYVEYRLWTRQEVRTLFAIDGVRDSCKIETMDKVRNPLAQVGKVVREPCKL